MITASDGLHHYRNCACAAWPAGISDLVGRSHTSRVIHLLKAGGVLSTTRGALIVSGRHMLAGTPELVVRACEDTVRCRTQMRLPRLLNRKPTSIACAC